MYVIIALRRSNKIGSRLIRWCTGEDWSHIGLTFDEQTVYHSDASGCKKETAEDYFKGSEVSWVRLPLTRADFTSAQWRAEAAVKRRTKYDLLGVVGFGLILLLNKRLGIPLPRPIFNPKWMFCSEFVEYVMFNQNTTLTPHEVYDKCVNTFQVPNK